MFLFFYNVVLLLGFPVIVSLLLTKKRSQRGILARLGNVPASLQRLSGPVVWIHAASLGEVTAIVPLLKAMKKENPGQELVVSTVTETGREMVLSKLEGIATHCYAPIDFWWAVTRYVHVLRPRLFLLVESEFWPNLLTSLERHQVPVCVINGRISSRSYSRHRIIKGFMKAIWASIDMALMQTGRDANRMKAFGVPAEVVHVTGNMKFDQSFEHQKNTESMKALQTSLGVGDAEQIIVAGSTHPQEEESLLEAFQALKAERENLVLIMAPRHIERANDLEQVIVAYGFTCIRRSAMSEQHTLATGDLSPRVILLDSRGELPYVYGLGAVSFVGGTLVPVGGHNLLEPAQWGCPVIFGPYVDHCRDIAHQLLESGGALQVQEPDTVLNPLLHLLTHPLEAEHMGQQALSVIQKNRGVVEKNHRMIRQLSCYADPTATHVRRNGAKDCVQPSSQTENHYDFSIRGSS